MDLGRKPTSCQETLFTEDGDCIGDEQRDVDDRPEAEEEVEHVEMSSSAVAERVQEEEEPEHTSSPQKHVKW